MERERFQGGREEGRVIVRDFPRPPHHYGHGQQRQLQCFSDEVSSRDGEEERRDGSVPPAASSGGGDGASAETVKRRRGRPPGSRNKPKTPVVVTRDVEPAAAMRPHVLEIPGGGDVALALAAFARRRGVGICVLAGTGAVADVSLRHPSSPDAAAADGRGAAVVVFRGRYEILSISATFLPDSMSAAVPRAVGRDLSVSLAGPNGQIVGGAVAGPIVAVTTVVVLAAAFADLTFHRLPLEDVDASASVPGSGEAADERRVRQPAEPHDASPLHQHPRNMAPVPLYARQHQDAWPAAATTQHPRRAPPYE